MKRFRIFILLLGAVLTACQPTNSPGKRTCKVVEYERTYLEDYGHFYDSIPANVYALDMYNEDLKLNLQGKIVGTGYNLYLSDIFSTDTILPSGIYHSDTTGLDYTFLPGHDYEGTPHGAYLLKITDGKIDQIQVLHEGGFDLRYDQDTAEIDLWFTEHNDTTYKAHYRGRLRPQKQQ